MERVLTLEKKLASNRTEQMTNKTTLIERVSRESPKIYFNRLKSLKTQEEKLEKDLKSAFQYLEEARQGMVTAQQKTEMLRKHKTKSEELFKLDEKKKEEYLLNEMGLMMKIRRDREEAEDKDDI